MILTYLLKLKTDMKMSYFWHASSITVGITALLSKNKDIHNLAIKTFGLLTVAEFVNKLHKKYFYKHKSAIAINSIFQLGVLKYYSNATAIFALHNTNVSSVSAALNPLMYSLNYYQNTMQIISDASFKINAIALICMTISYPICKLYLNDMVRNVLSDNQIISQIGALTLPLHNLVEIIGNSLRADVFIQRNNDHIRSVVVEPEVIERFAPMRVGRDEIIDHESDPNICGVCHEEFRITTSHRILPCNHMFHTACIDEWLQTSNATCPMCRHDIRDPFIEPYRPNFDNMSHSSVSDVETGN